MGGLTLLLVIMLIVANKKLYVFEDPRIDVVNDLLPQANCGACGKPGCRPFAEALVSGELLPGKCSVNSEEGQVAIAEYLGVSLGAEEKQVARLACAGGKNVAINRANYHGLDSCRGAALISGGEKGCFYGCLGHGDCKVVCDFDAIHLNEHGLPVIDVDKCTACGDCVEACPKALLSIQPLSHHLWVACKNLEFGDQVLEDCEVGCTACGKCAVDASDGLIAMEHQLPVIQYGKAVQNREAIDRCASGAIVWWDKDKGPQRGKESRKIIRKGEKRVGLS
ncbi:ferredoxin [Persicobacter diffluens]|uniref:Ion-translocating oxidoreductase complex subunit B n=1 Tax=Persicobacter diffluens TaxID=981 RepID=A0AAN4VZ98_9BACT|nr:ferredoxin [Persicobacter diffluens]